MTRECIRGCAESIMDTIPLAMRDIVGEIHKRETSDLSMPQFHALMFIKHHEGSSLSAVAQHIGSTISTSSKLIDGLVERGFLTRDIPGSNRRRVTLVITEIGEASLESVHTAAVSCLTTRLAALRSEDAILITRAMSLLYSIFTQAQGDDVCRRK
jgi:DNA-binding MarR family transcriptional regulator